MACPLCGSDASNTLGTLPVGAALSTLGLDRPIETVTEPPHPASTDLLACESCGLHYFWPQVIGSSRFYEALAEPGDFYQPLRWEHEMMLAQVDHTTRLVDLGCGAGTFVAAAAQRGADATGVDFAGVGEHESGGGARFLTARADLLDVALEVPELVGQCDLVTAFHLVEHLADPVEFVRRASTLVRPGGGLVVSLPNRHRFGIDRVQVLDCPPHHQTRWTEQQLRELGQRAGVRVRWVRVERESNPAKIANRLVRRALQARSTPNWPLPPAAGPWPLRNVLNGMSLAVMYQPA